MKKTLVLFSILVVGQMVSAQVTIYPRDTSLYYYWWYEDLISDSTQRVWFDRLSSFYVYPQSTPMVALAEVAQYLYTDTTLDILGVRVCSPLLEDNSFFHRGGPDSLIYADNLNVSLYEKEGDSMRLLAQKHVYRDNLFPHHSIMRVNLQEVPPESDSCRYRLLDYGMSFREYYFDSQITVNDSFFVSVSTKADQPLLSGTNTFYYYYFWSQNYNMEQCNPEVDRFPTFRYRYKLAYVTTDNTYIIPDVWYDTVLQSYPLVFPIVKYGTVFSNCAPVEGLCVSKQEGATFQFEWSDSNMSHLGWEFTYVPDGASPEGGTVETCSTPSASVTVPSGIRYRAFVRPSCIADRYGDWGDGVPFCYNCSSDAVSAADAATQVYPNPTASTVEVVSTYKVLQVDVLDARGVRLLTVTSGGTTISIDLSDYPDGVYLFRVRTDEGTATKQIVKTSYPPTK